MVQVDEPPPFLLGIYLGLVHCDYRVLYIGVLLSYFGAYCVLYSNVNQANVSRILIVIDHA